MFAGSPNVKTITIESMRKKFAAAKKRSFYTESEHCVGMTAYEFAHTKFIVSDESIIQVDGHTVLFVAYR